MNCKEIIKKYLDDNGFDGLCSYDCGCSKNDLMPCGENFEDCSPAYLRDCKKDKRIFECTEHDHCFSTTKEKGCIKGRDA